MKLGRSLRRITNHRMIYWGWLKLMCQPEYSQQQEVISTGWSLPEFTGRIGTLQVNHLMPSLRRCGFHSFGPHLMTRGRGRRPHPLNDSDIRCLLVTHCQLVAVAFNRHPHPVAHNNNHLTQWLGKLQTLCHNPPKGTWSSFDCNNLTRPHIHGPLRWYGGNAIWRIINIYRANCTSSS